METITKEIDGIEFYITQTPGLKVQRIERKTNILLLPIISNLIPKDIKDSKNKKSIMDMLLDIDLSGAILSLKDALSGMDDKEYESYVFSMVEYTKAKKEKEQPVELKNPDNYDKLFTGVSPLTLYKLLFEIMRFNRFSFFELVGGLGMDLTNISTLFKKKMNELNENLEKSES